MLEAVNVDIQTAFEKCTSISRQNIQFTLDLKTVHFIQTIDLNREYLIQTPSV